MNPYKKMLLLYKNGFRQSTDITCGPASVRLAAYGLGLNEVPELAWQDQRFANWAPVLDFGTRGIALHELYFLTEMIYCNQLALFPKRAYPDSFSSFQEDVILAFQARNLVIICNFLQDDFIKTNTNCSYGNPHYSPIIDFDNKGNVLIADIDREVKEPYWVSMEAVFLSMSKIHPTFNLPRGWLILKLIDSK